ncbi:DMT family transporter [Geminicoccaceae bacterium 1502E]|nr:DMT family transporter [Geminicoccaceae bacterium 1502E]
MQLLLPLLGVLAGALLSVQAGVNAQLSRGLGSPFLAALVSFGVGTLGLAAFVLALGSGTAAGWRTLPLHVWIAGGLLGACYVSANIFLVPRLGTAAVMSLIVCGQLLAALALDHFGLLGLAERGLGPARLAGAALLLAGVFLITRN